MKFILLGLLICMGHTFAATELEKKLEFITTKALKAKNLEAPKVPEALKSLKHFKHRKSHDHFTKNKMIVKKEKRQFKILNFIEDLKNEFGPVSVESIDSEDPNKLKFKVEGKTPHFSITEVKFKIAAPDERFRDITASVAVVESEIVTVDISLIEPGEYKLGLYIKYKLGANQKISLLRVSKSVFEKLYTESAHASLVEVSFNSSRVELDMSGSYSDFGNITSYSVKTFKDGELLSEDIFDPSVDGTIITESFLLKGTYQLELTVVDEFGDSDSVMSSEYVIENAAPSISFSVNQNEEYTNIFDIDLSQVSVDQGELESVSVEVYSDNGEAESFYFDGNDLFDSIKTIKTNLSGNIQIGVYAISQAGVDNFLMGPQGYIIDSPKASLFLRYSHSFISEGLSPYVKTYAFFSEDHLSDFDYFEVIITNEAGETSVYQQNDPYLSEGFIHAEVLYNSSGIYDASIVMVKKDGTRSLPFETRDRFVEVDLGVASLVMDLDFQNPETSRDLRWIVNLDESSAGNYGYFNNFSCEFRDKLSDNEFVIEKEWTEFYFTVDRGDYDVSCIGQTTAGLTSQNELKFSIDATNRAPEILNVDYFLVDTTWLEHHAYIEHNDLDGWIDYLIVKERYSNGVEYEYTVYDFISFSAIDLSLGTGSVDIELIAVDDEGEESEPYLFSVNFNNNAPEFNINIAAIDPLLRSYRFDFHATDDGYIESYQFVATDPDGHQHTYDFYETVDFTFWMAGTWNIEVTAFDNFGKPSTKSLDLTIENSLPNVLSLAIDDLSNRRFRITPASKDLDGYIVFDELIVSNPRGESQTYQLGQQSIELDFQIPGLYQLSYRVKDQDGAWSEAYLNSVEVINQIPVADFEITQISQNRFFLTSINSYDLDGEIAEFKTQFYGPNGEYVERFDANDFDIQLEAAGSWEVAHSVIDNDGASSDEKRISVEVINIAPTIELSYLEVDPATRTYQINAEISEDHGYYNTFVKITDPEGRINEFGTGFPFEYQFESAGTWTVEGRIVDQDGVESASTVHIDIPELPKELELIASLVNEVKREVLIDAINLPEINAVETELHFISDTGEEYERYDIEFPHTEIVLGPGAWTITAKLKTVDNVDLEISTSLYIQNTRPVSSIMLSKSSVEPDEQIEIAPVGSYDPNSDDLSFEWTISDGSTYSDKFIQHSFNDEGTYSVELVVTDEWGATSRSEKNIDVRYTTSANPEAVISLNGEQNENDEFFGSIQFDGTLSRSKRGEVTSYIWDFGDGESGTGKYQSHFYASAGNYEVSLLVTNSLGLTNEIKKSIVIEEGGERSSDPSPHTLQVVMSEENEKFKPLTTYADIITDSPSFWAKDRFVFTGEGDNVVKEITEISPNHLRVELTLENGINDLSFSFRDSELRELFYTKSVVAGTNSKNIVIKNSEGALLSNVSLKLKLLEQEYTYLTNASGEVLISNLPDEELQISIASEVCSLTYIGSSNSLPNEFFCEAIMPTSFSDVQVSQDFTGYTLNPVFASYSVDAEGFGGINYDIPEGQSGSIKSSFIYDGEKTLIGAGTIFTNIASNHKVVAKIKNLTKGEEVIQVLTSGGVFDEKVVAENGDVIFYEVSIENKNEVSFYQEILNDFSEIFVGSAYALDSTSLRKFNFTKSETSIEIVLADLGRVHQDPKKSKQLMIGKLGFFSVGDYAYNTDEVAAGNNVNTLYAVIVVKSVADTVTFKLSDAVLSQAGKNDVIGNISMFKNKFCKFSLEGKKNNKFEIRSDKVFPASFIEKCSVEPAEAELIALGDKLNNPTSITAFTPFMEIPIKNLDADNNIGVKIEHKIWSNNEYGNVSSSLKKPFFFNFHKDFLLSRLPSTLLLEVDLDDQDWRVEQNIEEEGSGTPESYNLLDGNHYNELNSEPPEKGDYWANSDTITLLESWYSQGGQFKFGDISNINGDENDSRYDLFGGRTYFQPHGAHRTGKNFDFLTPNFHMGNLYFGLGAILDLQNLFKTATYRDPEKTSQIEFTIGAGKQSKFKKIYENTCFVGRTIDEQVKTMEKGHHDHFHAELTYADDVNRVVFKEPLSNELVYSAASHTASLSKKTVRFKQGSLSKDSFILFNSKHEILMDNIDFSKKTQLTLKGATFSFETDNPGLTFSIKNDGLLDTMQELDNYYLLATNIGEEGVNECGSVKVSLAELAQSLVITDCNGNGVEGDVVHVNPFGGFVENTAQVHEGATIANGARVCGSSIINSPDVFIEGVDTIVDDSEIGDELIGNYYYINNSLIRSSKLYGDGQKYIVNSDIRDTNAFGQIFMSNAITINSSLEADVFYYPRFDWHMGISIDGGQVIDSKILGVTLVKGIANGARLVRGQTPREIFYQNGSLDGLYNLHIFTSGAVESDASLVGWGGLEGSVKNGAFASMVARRNERGSFEGGVIRKGAALSGASSSASGNFRIESGTLIGTIGNNQGWSPDTGFYSLDQNN